MINICPSFHPKVEKLHHDSSNLQVIISPLEKNFGSSFANMLRRVVLRYTPGIHIIGIKIHGVSLLHPYSTIHGIKESVSEILTNIKTITIPLSSIKTGVLYIKKKGPYNIKAKDIICPEGIEIINKNQHICTLEYDVQLDMELYVEVGCGFVPANYHGQLNNVLFCDTLFTPVRHVSYYIRSYATYEELIFYIKTNEGCDPLFAFNNAIHFMNNKTSIQIR